MNLEFERIIQRAEQKAREEERKVILERLRLIIEDLPSGHAAEHILKSLEIFVSAIER